MKTCAFRVVVEPDEGVYHAYCPALRRFGAVTTAIETHDNIHELVQVIINELREDRVALRF